MSHPATRRTFVAAALALPGATATKNTFAQDATPAASDVEIESIVRSFYEPFNTGDTTIYETILAEDWVSTPLDAGHQPGRAGFPPVIAQYRAAFPDLQVTNEDVIVAGNKTTVRSTNRGTHEGEFIGIPATGQPVEFMTIDIHQVENGQIVQSWHIEDLLGVLFQIGAVIQPGANGEATPEA